MSLVAYGASFSSKDANIMTVMLTQTTASAATTKKVLSVLFKRQKLSQNEL